MESEYLNLIIKSIPAGGSILFSTHTKPSGILAFTSAEEEDEIWSDNGGQMLYHASLRKKTLMQSPHILILDARLAPVAVCAL